MMTENIYQQAAAVLGIEDSLRWFGSLARMDSKIPKLINITVKKPCDLSDARGNIAESLIIPILTI